MEKSSTKKVLIIDDDSRNIFALRAVLRSKGFDVTTAGSGLEGISTIQNDQRVGVVLLDMMMPDMDGYEVLNLIRHSEQMAIPVISVTAQAMEGDREKCLGAGADAYLSKPIDVDELLRLLDEYMK